MGFIFNDVERSEIKPGDHIYSYRAAYTYSHHGIYVKENKVVHFTQLEGEDDGGVGKYFTSFRGSSAESFKASGFGANLRSTCPFDIPYCGTGLQTDSGVVVSCLDCFLQNGGLKRYEYGVSKWLLLGSRGGTCTTAVSDPPEMVIRRTMKLLQLGFGEYNLFKHNCEDFALFCKTGLIVSQNSTTKGSSSQVSQAFSMILIPAASAIRRTGPVGFVVSTTGTLLYSKYSHDIGVRTDVVRLDADTIPIYARRASSNQPSPPPAAATPDQADQTPVLIADQVRCHQSSPPPAGSHSVPDETPVIADQAHETVVIADQADGTPPVIADQADGTPPVIADQANGTPPVIADQERPHQPTPPAVSRYVPPHRRGRTSR